MGARPRINRVVPFPSEREHIEPVSPLRYVSFHMHELRILEPTTGRYRPWTVREISKVMGISIHAVNNLRTATSIDRLTPRICVALERLTGVRAENWAELQWRYDLRQERQRKRGDNGDHQ